MHVKVSSGRILNPKLLLMCCWHLEWQPLPSAYECMYELPEPARGISKLNGRLGPLAHQEQDDSDFMINIPAYNCCVCQHLSHAHKLNTSRAQTKQGWILDGVPLNEPE